jgi:hypothetical protein
MSKVFIKFLSLGILQGCLDSSVISNTKPDNHGHQRKRRDINKRNS